MTDQSSAQMHFALMIGGHGGCIGGWRMPGAKYGPEEFGLTVHCAEIAERAKLDMLFVADVPVSKAERPHQFEALTEIAALVGKTERIGLGATVSTSFSEPYNIARMLGTIDHMSGGRAAINIVTTAANGSSANFNLEPHPSKAERYERAGEFVEVLKGLWDSWEDDAVVADPATGMMVDLSKRHVLDHKGKHYTVKGPLNLSRCPQGYPVILQAGASDIGLPFAARIGEAIFTVELDAKSSVAFCKDLRARVARAGRDPSLVRVLPGFVPFVAETEAKAREMFDAMAAFVDPAAAAAKLAVRLGVDLAGLDPEGPVPQIPASEMGGFAKALTKLAEQRGFNLRQLRDYVGVTSHPPLIGTPEMVADELERWFRMGACDGFMVLPPFLPGPVEIFCEQVIPILRKRGLFRSEYTGKTLRDHLGLPRPSHPNAARYLDE